MATKILTDAYGRDAAEREALRLKRDAVNQYAKENWGDPLFHREMAQAITEAIYMGFEHENILPMFCGVENVGFDDRVLVKEVRGLRAFWVARGGYIHTSTMNAKVTELPRDTIGFHVYEFEDKVETNFAETQASLIQLGVERLDAEVNSRALATFQTAIGVSSSSYYTGSGLSLANLNLMIKRVRDHSRSQHVTIIGRATMTEQIMDDLLGASVNGSGFLPETNEDLIRRGVLGNYRGAQIVTLVNWLDDTDTSFFPANELYVIGDDAAKAAFFGPPKVKEWTEEEADYWHYRFRRDFGILVHRPDRAARFVDSGQAA